MEEKVLQLIHPNDRNWTAEEWIELLEKYPIGSFFCNTRNLAEMKKRNEEFKAGAQTAAPIATPAAPKAKVGGFNF